MTFKLPASLCALAVVAACGSSRGSRGTPENASAPPRAAPVPITRALDPVWLPLASMEENPTAEVDVVRTNGSKMTIQSFAVFDAEYPPGSDRLVAILTHEREHARRQFAYPGGVAAWNFRYATDASFRLAEEEIGWALEIRYLANAHLGVATQHDAAFLSGPTYGSMISYADALAFVESAYNNAGSP